MKNPVQSEIDAILEKAMIGEPRNMQQAIGPSEIGSDCEHCVAAKLAGWVQSEEAAWLPWVGTAMHAYLEPIFEKHPDYLTENRVSVAPWLSGTSDLFHIPSGTNVDWKLVGATTLKSARRGPTPVYRVQAHCYGLGYFRAGFQVNNVAIYYLPRNAMSLREGIFWSEPFDPLIALHAIERAERMMDTLASFASIEERDAYITSLPRAKHCWDCKRYHDAPKASPKTQTAESLLGL
jgi:hypothetical protein